MTQILSPEAEPQVSAEDILFDLDVSTALKLMNRQKMKSALSKLDGVLGILIHGDVNNQFADSQQLQEDCEYDKNMEAELDAQWNHPWGI